ncbi:uncharacterized protein K02A2.6-like [Anneissia japonica]|uniref:uncharacterized protein K02A2.6-like n=1 Tax=Anneissia japonica TaxID=1529436 RepID=UPI0014258B95|nr:uncharacterized protein K02A2.6-like [Anneissia japonica]
MSNGVIFKGQEIIIPQSLQANILQQLHLGLMGVEKTRRLVRESVYWSGINQDITRLVQTCPKCQENQPSQCKEPIKPHEVSPGPWTKLATDLFTINEYLLITEYYSKYPVVHKLSNTSSATIARAITGTFNLFGAPVEIMSDNGSQYTDKPFTCVPSG